MFVTVTIFELEPESVGLFRAAVTKHAEVTRQRENGCRRFDVCFDPKIPTRCLAYTVFADNAAYDHHIMSEHFNIFEEVTVPWVETRRLEFWNLIASPTRVG